MSTQSASTNGGLARAAAIPAEFTDSKPATKEPSWGFSDEQNADILSRWPRSGIIHRRGKLPYQIVFRAPRRAEYKRFRSMAAEPARRSEAQEMLARAIVVAVFWQGSAHVGEAKAREALDQLLEEFPAAVDSTAASETIERLMSGAIAEEEKD